MTPLLAYLQWRQLALVDEFVAGMAHDTVVIVVYRADAREWMVLAEAVLQRRQLVLHGKEGRLSSSAEALFSVFVS